MINSDYYYIGAAKKEIPVPDDFFPYHSWGPRRLTGVHDPLCVRVIYIDSPGKLLIVSVENGDIDPAWTQDLSKAVGVNCEQILISATHTHTAPYIGGYWPENVEDVEKSERYTKCAWKTLLDAVKEAMEHVQPVTLHYGEGSCSINVNRDKPGIDKETGKVVYRMDKNVRGFSDRTVSVLCFRSPEGEILAALFNYSVHSSVLFNTKMKDDGQLISGDIAGNAMSFVEKNTGCLAAMFTMAPAADQNPRFSATFNEPGEDGRMKHMNYGLGSYVLVDVLGRELGEEVISVLETMDTDLQVKDVQSAAGTISVPGKKKIEGFGIKWPESPDEYIPDGEVPLPLAVAAIDKLAIAGIGCETSGGNTARIKSVIQKAGFENVMIITQCNGSSSYMSDPVGYEVVTFSAQASHMMPESVSYMTTALGRLADEAKKRGKNG